MNTAIIIMNKNGSYGVVEVPENGKVYLREPHLICGVTQNGVKMVIYGLSSPLLPFETYIQNEALSLDIVGNELWHPGHRFLDFTNIELLQTQFTINPANSGSNTNFEAPTYEAGGYPINYNLRLKGANFSSAEQAQSWLRGDFGGSTPSKRNKDSIINALSNDGDYQLLSCLFVDPIMEWGLWNRPEFPITEVYDDNLFEQTQSYTLHSPTVEIFKLSSLLNLALHTWYQGGVAPNLKSLILPNLTGIGADATNNSIFNNIPNWVNIQVPRSFETSNAGAVEGDVQYAITTKQAIVKYID